MGRMGALAIRVKIVLESEKGVPADELDRIIRAIVNEHGAGKPLTIQDIQAELFYNKGVFALPGAIESILIAGCTA